MIILWARAYALEMQLLNCVNLHKIVKSLVAKYSIPFFGFMLPPLVHSLNWCWCVYLSLYQTFSVLNCGVWRVPDFTVIRKHHCDVLSVWCVYITALTSLFFYSTESWCSFYNPFDKFDSKHARSFFVSWTISGEREVEKTTSNCRPARASVTSHKHSRSLVENVNINRTRLKCQNHRKKTNFRCANRIKIKYEKNEIIQNCNRIKIAKTHVQNASRNRRHFNVKI